MALEAQEVAVRVAMLGGSQFKREAEQSAAAIEGVGAAGKKASAEMDAGFGASAVAGLTGFSNKLKSVGGKISQLGRSLAPASVAIGAGLFYAGKQYTAFNQKMTLLVTQARLAPKALNGVTQSVLNMSKTVGATPTALADALYPIESIGLRGKHAMDALKASAIGTAVGLDSLENTADAVTTVMASHIKGAGGPLHAMALMDSAIGQGKMHLADLTDSFKSAVIPMASTFGVTFPQILAAAAAMTREGTPAAQVMSRMRLTMTSMVAPTGAGAKALQNLGLSPFQLAADLKNGGLLSALQALKTSASKQNPYTANADIAAIFGRSRGLGNIEELLNALPQMKQIYGNVLATNTGTLMTHFAETQQTPAYKLAQIKANFDRSMIGLGKVVDTDVLPKLEALGTWLANVLSKFDKLPGPLQKIIIYGLALVAVLGPLGIIVGGLVTGIGILVGAVGSMTGAIASLIGVQGMAALRVGIASTTASFLTLAAPIAAILGVYEMWHNKTIRNAISHAGFTTGEGVVARLHGLGLFSSAYERNQAIDYLQSKAYTRLNPVLRSDIAGLMQPGSYAQTHIGTVASDLKGSGVNIDKIPGISAAIKQAIKDGMSNAHVSVLLPDGKVIAQTVNTANRKQQNRR